MSRRIRCRPSWDRDGKKKASKDEYSCPHKQTENENDDEDEDDWRGTCIFALSDIFETIGSDWRDLDAFAPPQSSSSSVVVWQGENLREASTSHLNCVDTSIRR